MGSSWTPVGLIKAVLPLFVGCLVGAVWSGMVRTTSTPNLRTSSQVQREPLLKEVWNFSRSYLVSISSRVGSGTGLDWRRYKCTHNLKFVDPHSSRSRRPLDARIMSLTHHVQWLCSRGFPRRVRARLNYYWTWLHTQHTNARPLAHADTWTHTSRGT